MRIAPDADEPPGSLFGGDQISSIGRPGFIRVMMRGAGGAAYLTIFQVDALDQRAHGLDAAAAARRAAEAAVCLTGRAGSRRVVALERLENLGLGQDVAGANDHVESTLE